MTGQLPRCPRCGSDNILPVEHGEDYSREEAPEVAIYAGITITSIILAGLILIALFPPLAVVVVSGWLGWLWNRKKKRRPSRGPFICLSCSTIFDGESRNPELK